MSNFYTFAFLFFLGSVFGWVLELFYRRFISSSNPQHKWQNPGFCTGPYLPIYGFGVVGLYSMANIEQYLNISNPILQKLVLFALMTLTMTLIEFFAGLVMLKVFKVRLWDYSDNKGNLMGLVCPLYTIFWTLLGVIYYFLVHPYIQIILSSMYEYSGTKFLVGMFYGVFFVDVVRSGDIVTKIKKFADANNVVVRYEKLKEQIKNRRGNAKFKNFVFSFKSDIPLVEHLRETVADLEKRLKK